MLFIHLHWLKYITYKVYPRNGGTTQAATFSQAGFSSLTQGQGLGLAEGWAVPWVLPTSPPWQFGPLVLPKFTVKAVLKENGFKDNGHMPQKDPPHSCLPGLGPAPLYVEPNFLLITELVWMRDSLVKYKTLSSHFLFSYWPKQPYFFPSVWLNFKHVSSWW